MAFCGPVLCNNETFSLESLADVRILSYNVKGNVLHVEFPPFDPEMARWGSEGSTALSWTLHKLKNGHIQDEISRPMPHHGYIHLFSSLRLSDRSECRNSTTVSRQLISPNRTFNSWPTRAICGCRKIPVKYRKMMPGQRKNCRPLSNNGLPGLASTEMAESSAKILCCQGDKLP